MVEPKIDLRLGDCLAPDGLPSLADKSVDHVICDPPFASEIYERTRKNPARHTNGAGKNVVSRGLLSLARGEIGTLDGVVDAAMREVARLTRRWALVFCDVESVGRVRLALVGMKHVRVGVWAKDGPMPQFSGDRPAQGFEACEISHAADSKLRWNGGGKAALWFHALCKGNERPDHPCPKPESLMEELISDFTDPGELVCDPFAGSGTTAVACKRLGRNFVGWEKDKKFWEAAMRRIENTKQQYELLPRGPKPHQLKLTP